MKHLNKPILTSKNFKEKTWVPNTYITTKDPIYNSMWVRKFLNTTLISEGKKEKGEKILYAAIKALKKIYRGKNSIPILFESAEKMKGAIETRPLRLGGNIVAVPLYIIGIRRVKLALLKYRQAFWKRSESKVVTRIIREIVSILRNPKDSFLGQMDLKSWDVIYNNRSYIHYRWY